MAAIAAAAGGSLWIVKSVAIILTNRQPDYTFELAPLCFGLAVGGMVFERTKSGDRVGLLPAILAAVAAIAGMASSVIYITSGDTDFFGVFVMIALVAIVGVLLTVGRNTDSSAYPSRLGLLMMAAIPIGGALSAIDDRLLEVPLVAVGGGWLFLAAAIARRKPGPA